MGVSFWHVELEGNIPGLCFVDSINLSDIALDIFNLDIRLMIELAFGRVGLAHLTQVGKPLGLKLLFEREFCNAGWLKLIPELICMHISLN